MKNTYWIILLLFFPLLRMKAQNNAVTSSGEASGSGGSSSYSIGQVFYERPVGEGFSTVQGLQQPIEIVVLDNTTFETNPQIKIYPNPVYSGFYIALPDADYERSDYNLYNSNGKLVIKGRITSAEIFVEIESLVPGIYVLKINNSDKEYGYKIVKR